MTKFLMISLTQQLPKIARKKKASHSSSIREPDFHFRKQMDKQDQAQVTMKLEEAENIKFEYVRKVQKTTPQTKIIPDSDNELAKKK